MAKPAISVCVHETGSVVEQLQSGVRCHSSSHPLLIVKCSSLFSNHCHSCIQTHKKAAVIIFSSPPVSRFCQCSVPALNLIDADDPLI